MDEGSSSDLPSSSDISSGDFRVLSAALLVSLVELSFATSASSASSSDCSFPPEYCRSNAAPLFSLDSDPLPWCTGGHSLSVGLLPLESAPLLEDPTSVSVFCAVRTDHFVRTLETLLSSSWFFVAIGRYFKVEISWKQVKEVSIKQVADRVWHCIIIFGSFESCQDKLF